MRKFLETSKTKLMMMMLVAAMALTVGCSGGEKEESQPATLESEAGQESKTKDIKTKDIQTTEPSDGVQVVGEGETTFMFDVEFEDGSIHKYEVKTDETTVGAALIAVGLIEGEDSEYGLYVKTVDGVTLDFDADAAYWAFFAGDEMAATGVDSTEIEAGVHYKFAFAK